MTKTAIIRRCATLSEAYIVDGLLRSSGVLSSIDNANHATIDWGSVSALGGIQIRVPNSQFERSKEIIIEHAGAAEETLDEMFEPYDAPVKTRRLTAISMLLIYVGIIDIPVLLIFMWLATIIPAGWFDPPPNEFFYVEPYYGSAAVPEASGTNGWILVFLIVFILLWELTNTRTNKQSKDPT
ncbi:MAG: putative signal transducing protein [Henriciella sp.]